MFRIFILTISLFGAFTLSAQISRSDKGNEWIDYSKEYHKLQVAKDGIYTITNADLEAMGINVSDKGNVHLYNLGKEVRLVEDESGLLFYGKRNRGEFDAMGFDKDEDVLNPDYSIITDTAAYFLMVDPAKTALRYKKVDQDISGNTIAPTPYYMHTELVSYHSYANKPAGDANSKVLYSKLLLGEGYSFPTTKKMRAEVPVSALHKEGASTVLSIRATSNLASVHNIELKVNGTIVKNYTFFSENMMIDDFTLNNSDISKKIIVDIEGKHSDADRFCLATLKATYPRDFKYIKGKIWSLTIPKVAARQYIEIDGAPQDLLILNESNGEWMHVQNAGSGRRAFLLPPSSEDIRLIAFSPTDISRPNNAGKRVFENLSNKQNDYLIISHPKLMESMTAGTPMSDYVAYRSSAEGGGFNPIVVDVNQLYDQYGYGINRHFMAIRNFGKELKTSWNNLAYIFLIGKGVNYAKSRQETPTILARNLVPTFGYPTSDNLLILDAKESHQNYPIGRLAAVESKTISDYLEKVKTYESYKNLGQTVEDKAWMKKVFHLGGGEQQFITRLKQLSYVIENNKLGAKVFSFGKSGSGAVDNTFFKKSYGIINSGVSIITFMGHTSVDVFEANLDNPQNYNNSGKFPLFFALGCYSGDVCSASYGISEKFVNIPDKGSVSFLATTGQSYPTDQYLFTNFVYKSMGGDKYGGRIGDVIKAALDSVYVPTVHKGRNTFIQQLLLNGDPALKLLSFEGPDYTFLPAAAKTSPRTVQPSDEKINFSVDVQNIGTYTSNEIIDIEYKHFSPDGRLKYTGLKKGITVANTKSVTVTIPISKTDIGRNVIKAKIITSDGQEAPLPSALQNNDLLVNSKEGYVFYVVDNFANPTYPSEFGMINTVEHFVLKACTPIVPVERTRYVFEIDTTAYFNSPIKNIGKVESEGGVIEYKPTIPIIKDQVYYWRVSPDSTGPSDSFKWGESSFSYFPDEEEGWNQSHFFQFQKNDGVDINISEGSYREFEFGRVNQNAVFKNKVWSPTDVPGYTWNDVTFGSVRPWLYMDAGLAFVLYDQALGDFPRNGIGGDYGSINPTKMTIAVYPFYTQTVEQRKAIVEFINKRLPKNYYVTVFTVLKDKSADLNIKDWENDKSIYGTNIYEALGSIGASKINELKTKGSVPYILQTVTKSGPVVLNEVVGDSITSVIQSRVNAYKFKDSGEIRSTVIGPIQEFKTIKNDIFSNEKDKENLTFNIYDRDKQKKGSLGITDSITSVSEVKYPYASMSLKSWDSEENTPVQLNYWRITGLAYPDAAITYLSHTPKDLSKLSPGQEVSIAYAASDANFRGMDSLLVTVSYTTENNKVVSRFKRIGKLSMGGTIQDTVIVRIPRNLTGNLVFSIELNPNLDQPEEVKYNNLLLLYGKIIKSNIAPDMKVTFDGYEIVNGEIVSSKPIIEIEAMGNSKFAYIDNVNAYSLQLKDNSGNLSTIDLTSDMVNFVPATEANRKSKIVYKPHLKDGMYTLYAQAKGAIGNKERSTVVSFRVVDKKAVSNVFNYPNPFSTSTQFIFTLTGYELPSHYSITIYTMSGKVVRELTAEELGPLKIGTNKTIFKWNGTDEYGNKLGNGVYLYKVNVSDPKGKAFEKLKNPNTDSYFKKGFGKLVILR